MARIRTIKPDFWVDEKVVECSAFARLCFIGLWNFADDDGRMEYRPRKIKMQIFPADTLDISELIGELRGEKLVEVYVVDDKEYLRICGFHKHQKIDRRLSSKHPAPDGSPRLTPTLPDGREGKGREKEVKETIKEKKPKPKRAKSKKAFPFESIPQDWIESARENKRYTGLSFELEAEKFVNWHLSKGNVYADWKRTWWSWLGIALERMKENTPQAPNRAAMQKQAEDQERLYSGGLA